MKLIIFLIFFATFCKLNFSFSVKNDFSSFQNYRNLLAYILNETKSIDGLILVDAENLIGHADEPDDYMRTIGDFLISSLYNEPQVPYFDEFGAEFYQLSCQEIEEELKTLFQVSKHFLLKAVRNEETIKMLKTLLSDLRKIGYDNFDFISKVIDTIADNYAAQNHIFTMIDNLDEEIQQEIETIAKYCRKGDYRVGGVIEVPEEVEEEGLLDVLMQNGQDLLDLIGLGGENFDENLILEENPEFDVFEEFDEQANTGFNMTNENQEPNVLTIILKPENTRNLEDLQENPLENPEPEDVDLLNLLAENPEVAEFLFGKVVPENVEESALGEDIEAQEIFEDIPEAENLVFSNFEVEDPQQNFKIKKRKEENPEFLDTRDSNDDFLFDYLEVNDKSLLNQENLNNKEDSNIDNMQEKIIIVNIQYPQKPFSENKFKTDENMENHENFDTENIRENKNELKNKELFRKDDNFENKEGMTLENFANEENLEIDGYPEDEQLSENFSKLQRENQNFIINNLQAQNEETEKFEVKNLEKSEKVPDKINFKINFPEDVEQLNEIEDSNDGQGMEFSDQKINDQTLMETNLNNKEKEKEDFKNLDFQEDSEYGDIKSDEEDVKFIKDPDLEELTEDNEKSKIQDNVLEKIIENAERNMKYEGYSEYSEEKYAAQETREFKDLEENDNFNQESENSEKSALNFETFLQIPENFWQIPLGFWQNFQNFWQTYSDSSANSQNFSQNNEEFHLKSDDFNETDSRIKLLEGEKMFETDSDLQNLSHFEESVEPKNQDFSVINLDSGNIGDTQNFDDENPEDFMPIDGEIEDSKHMKNDFVPKFSEDFSEGEHLENDANFDENNANFEGEILDFLGITENEKKFDNEEKLESEENLIKSPDDDILDTKDFDNEDFEGEIFDDETKNVKDSFINEIQEPINDAEILDDLEQSNLELIADEEVLNDERVFGEKESDFNDSREQSGDLNEIINNNLKDESQKSGEEGENLKKERQEMSNNRKEIKNPKKENQHSKILKTLGNFEPNNPKNHDPSENSNAKTKIVKDVFQNSDENEKDTESSIAENLKLSKIEAQDKENEDFKNENQEDTNSHLKERKEQEIQELMEIMEENQKTEDTDEVATYSEELDDRSSDKIEEILE